MYNNIFDLGNALQYPMTRFHSSKLKLELKLNFEIILGIITKLE